MAIEKSPHPKIGSLLMQGAYFLFQYHHPKQTACPILSGAKDRSLNERSMVKAAISFAVPFMGWMSIVY